VALSANRILEQVGITPDGPVLFSLLQGVIPPVMGLVIIAAIMSASLSTADGAILGTSSVIAHNVLGIRHSHHENGFEGGDKLLLITRLMAIFITLLGVFFAIKVPETGVLLLLAFDLGFAGLLVPLTGGLFWTRSTWQGAVACIIVGSITRLILFVLMPTMFGVDNTLLYIENNLFTADFDGFPTLISPLVGLVVFIIVSNTTYKPLKAEFAVTEEKVNSL